MDTADKSTLKVTNGKTWSTKGILFRCIQNAGFCGASKYYTSVVRDVSAAKCQGSFSLEPLVIYSISDMAQNYLLINLLKCD